MVLEHLDDLLALQVPDVHLVVLGPRDDPLAARHGERGKDAVLFVLVAGVRFEALASVVVPQAQRVVEGGSENILAVW